MSPIARLDRFAHGLGWERVHARPFRRGLWVGGSGAGILRLRASVEAGSGLGLRLDLSTPIRSPRFLVERGPDAWRVDGDRAAAACVPPFVLDALQVGDAIGLSATGVFFTSRRTDTVGRLRARLSDLEEVARIFQTSSMPDLLWQRCRDAADPELRAESSRALFERFPDSEQARAARRAAERDGSAPVRVAAWAGLPAEQALKAARDLAEAGHASLELLMCAIDTLSSQTLSSFDGFGPETEAAALDALLRLSQAPEDRLRARAVYAAGSFGQRGLSALPLAVADPSLEVRRAAAEALGQIGGAEAEALLITLLGKPTRGAPRPDELRLRRTVVEVLGRAGTARSIPALTRFSEGAGLRAPLSPSVQVAIRNIRRRIAHKNRGGLAVVLPGDGHLSETLERSGTRMPGVKGRPEPE